MIANAIKYVIAVIAMNAVNVTMTREAKDD